jgi:UDP:flavonoid glycosyltransferase YjiC (YdhE family)
MHLRLPYVQIWNILHFDSSGSTPVALYSWPYETTPEALARNVEGLQIFREYREALMPVAQSYAERNGLEIDWSNPAATISKLAVITQTPKIFDFPIAHLPPQFHYAGPFHDNAGREPVSFPWEKLTGKPLIYASMGTLVNGLKKVYGTIIEAVSEFPEMQVVLAVGRNLSPSDLGPACGALHNPCGAKYRSGGVGTGSADGGDSDRIRPTWCRRQDCLPRGW